MVTMVSNLNCVCTELALAPDMGQRDTYLTLSMDTFNKKRIFFLFFCFVTVQQGCQHSVYCESNLYSLAPIPKTLPVVTFLAS